MSWIIDLDKEENNLIKDLIKNILADPSLKPETFCNESKENSKILPEKLKLALMNFIGLSNLEKNNSDIGILLIKNINFVKSYFIIQILLIFPYIFYLITKTFFISLCVSLILYTLLIIFFKKKHLEN